MSRKESRPLKHDLASAEKPDSLTRADVESEIFTPEQWKALQDQSREREKDYVPTRSLIPGL